MSCCYELVLKHRHFTNLKKKLTLKGYHQIQWLNTNSSSKYLTESSLHFELNSAQLSVQLTIYTSIDI